MGRRQEWTMGGEKDMLSEKDVRLPSLGRRPQSCFSISNTRQLSRAGSHRSTSERAEPSRHQGAFTPTSCHLTERLRGRLYVRANSQDGASTPDPQHTPAQRRRHTGNGRCRKKSSSSASLFSPAAACWFRVAAASSSV